MAGKHITLLQHPLELDIFHSINQSDLPTCRSWAHLVVLLLPITLRGLYAAVRCPLNCSSISLQAKQMRHHSTSRSAEQSRDMQQAMALVSFTAAAATTYMMQTAASGRVHSSNCLVVSAASILGVLLHTRLPLSAQSPSFPQVVLPRPRLVWLL